MTLNHKAYCVIICALISCTSRTNNERIKSSIVVSHEECTDCFDASVEYGNLIIPEAIEKRIVEEEKRTGVKTSRKTLILTGKGNISEELFGDQSNFIERWNRKYLIDGYVTDFKNGAIVFYVVNYKSIEK